MIRASNGIHVTSRGLGRSPRSTLSAGRSPDRGISPILKYLRTGRRYRDRGCRKCAREKPARIRGRRTRSSYFSFWPAFKFKHQKLFFKILFFIFFSFHRNSIIHSNGCFHSESVLLNIFFLLRLPDLA